MSSIKIVEVESGFAPRFMSEGAACMDVFARDITFNADHGYLKVKLGFKVEIPDGYVMNLNARSSVSDKGLILCNGTGKIDPDFRGEVQARFYPAFTSELVAVAISGTSGIAKYMLGKFKKGEAVAQIEIVKTETKDFNLEFVSDKDLSETKRGENGHGSTSK